MQVDSLEDQTQSVPLNVSFILFGIVTEQNSIFVDLNKDGSNLEYYCLEPNHLLNCLCLIQLCLFLPSVTSGKW